MRLLWGRAIRTGQFYLSDLISDFLVYCGKSAYSTLCIMVSQRKCCVKGCENNYTNRTLFSFPKADWTDSKGNDRFVHKGLRRTLYWIQKSGNMSLLKERPEALRKRYFMCTDHFDAEYLCTKKGRILKSNALPYVVEHTGISLEDMEKYISWIKASDGSDSPFSLKQKTCDQNENAVPNKRPSRRCKVLNCGITDLQGTMFAFPRPSIMTFIGAHIDTQNYIRCKLWVQATGNESLLALSPLNLWRQAYICPAHFEDHHFYSKMKRKLLHSAVPSRLLPPPLSDEKMKDYNRLFYSEGEITRKIHSVHLHPKPLSRINISSEAEK